MLHIERGPVLPAMRLRIPFDRHTGITPLDSGIGEDRQQALDIPPAAELHADAFGNDSLVEDVRRNGGLERKQARQRGGGSTHTKSPNRATPNSLTIVKS